MLRALADGCLAVLIGAALVPAVRVPFLVTAGVVPYLVVACAGASLTRLGGRRLLLGSAGLAAGTALVGGLLRGQSVGLLALLGVSVALSDLARDLLAPALAREARLSLHRLGSAHRSATAACFVAGLIVAYRLTPPLAFAVSGVLNLLALLIAASLREKASKAAPSEPAFLVAGWRLCRHPDTGTPLLGLAGLAFLAVLGCLVAIPVAPAVHGGLREAVCWLGLGVSLGALAAAILSHPFRVLALVPLGMTALCGALLWAATHQTAECLLWLLIGACAGLAEVPLRTSYLAHLPVAARGQGVAWLNGAPMLAAALAGVVALSLGRLTWLDGGTSRWVLLIGLAAITLPAVWWAFLRPLVEEATATLVEPCYRIRVHGPGRDQFPMNGPAIVLANHGAWFDPFWLGMVMPRHMTPLMISIYYDRPIIHWLVSRVVKAIRVEDRPFRREAPELQEAVAALDRGECVLIFPEGVVRRKEEQLLRPFGQGIWRILCARPTTPVVVCWIEGGWRSFTSYYQGPPMTNKPLDWRRPIDIVICPPQVLDPALLADQRATRQYLQQACLDARRPLGLEPVPQQNAPLPEPVVEKR